MQWENANAAGKVSQTDKHSRESRGQEESPRNGVRPLRWLWGGLLAAMAIVGFAYQFRPEINVDRDTSLDVHDPFATQFRITNDGELAVYDLRFSCTVENAVMHNVGTLGSEGQTAVQVLESKESTTKNCGINTLSFPLLSDLYFNVTYTPKWYWKPLTKQVRFVNMRDSQGVLQWFKQPLPPN